MGGSFKKKYGKMKIFSIGKDLSTLVMEEKKMSMEWEQVKYAGENGKIYYWKRARLCNTKQEQKTVGWGEILEI